jgi:hypothetical protein
MGILLVPKAGPQAIGGKAHAVGWKEGRQVAVPLPTPSAPGYDRAMERFDRWRSYGSPLGGISAAPWGTPPAGLKPEFRPRQAWRGSVPGQRDPGDMSQYQHQPYPGRK